MSLKSAIEWTNSTWNPVTGCTKVSAGCDRCYAERFSERFRGVKGHPFEPGFDLTLRPKRLEQPLHWRRPQLIFVNSMSDLFHKEIPDEYIRQVFDTMERADWHIYQILTKRSSLMRDFVGKHYGKKPVPSHIWLGVSIEDSAALTTPATSEADECLHALRFLRAAAGSDRRSRSGGDSLGHRRGRERTGRASHGGGMGAFLARSVLDAASPFLLQAVGRTHSQGWRQYPRRMPVAEVPGHGVRPGVGGAVASCRGAFRLFRRPSRNENMNTTGASVLTIGHSTHDSEAFVALLQRYGVTDVADVRSSPYSRFNPQFNREALANRLAACGIEYAFLGRNWAGARTMRRATKTGKSAMIGYAKPDRSREESSGSYGIWPDAASHSCVRKKNRWNVTAPCSWRKRSRRKASPSNTSWRTANWRPMPPPWTGC